MKMYTNVKVFRSRTETKFTFGLENYSVPRRLTDAALVRTVVETVADYAADHGAPFTFFTPGGLRPAYDRGHFDLTIWAS